MHKKRTAFLKIIFSALLTIVIFAGLAAITGKVIGYLNNEVYESRLQLAENLDSVISSNLEIDTQVLDGLENNDLEKINNVRSVLNKKIYEVKTLDILDEDILNVVIYDVRDAADVKAAFKYKDEDTYGFIIPENQSEGKLKEDCFMSYCASSDEAGNVLAYTVLYTSRENYDIWLKKCDDSFKMLGLAYAIILIYFFIMYVIKIKREKDLDSATGLSSKGQYKREIEKIIAKYPNENGVLYVIGFRDLFDFEAPNTEIIEDVIYRFAAILKKYRGKKAVVARVSERKLGLYLHDVKSNEQILDKVLKDVETLLRSRREYENIQYYMGVAFYPEHEKNVDELVNGAIYALETLRKGKKQYHIRNFQLYDPNSRKEFVDKQYLYDEVEKIINERRIYSVFQAIVDLKTGDIMGYEALSRPISELVPNIGMLISLATEMGIMGDLELLLIYIINKTVFEYKESFLDKWLFINTNVSIKYGDKELSKFKNTIEKITQNLVVEITEYDEIDFEIITSRINKVKSFGAKIAIDDFGSGYSNELALLSLKPDIVKIDMGLIRNIDKDQRKFQIVENLTKYSANNGIKVLAEGVETSAELRVVRDLNIDYVQGYIFAKPEKNVIQKHFDVEEYISRGID